jgi:glycerophosphoryl diester phosphodiesterase
LRIVAHRGTRLQAPENSRQALLSAYTAGADVLEFDVQLTKDGRLVVSHDGTIARLTNEPGTILEMTLHELRHTRGKYDFSATFNPTGNDGFRYFRPGRRLQIEIFEDLLDLLPRDVDKLIEFKHDSSPDVQTRRRFVIAGLEGLRNRDLITNTVVYSKDPETLRLIRELEPRLRIAAFDWELTGEEQIDLMLRCNADGLVTSIDTILDNSGMLTATGEKLQRAFQQKSLAVGAVLYPFRGPGVATSFTESEFRALSRLDFVWSVSTDSMLGLDVDGQFVDVAALLDREWTWVDEPFAGTSVNRDLWALGYAKAHNLPDDNAYIYQDNGIHIETRDYTGWLPPKTPSADPTVAGVEDLELRMLHVEKNWPFYTGGGVGLITGINGDFIAEVDYEVRRPLTQATTLEMAVVNVDPGAHQSSPPTSFRQKDSFYDPHGAPPFVGVEHDENDGFRINWNLGGEYDSNQYGPPVGDGITPTKGRLRLERRGSYFAAYYQNQEVGKARWICVGAVQNQSLNDVIYLRCAAKRWRQEKEDNPSEYWPIAANTFTFRNLTIRRWRSR